MIFGVKEIFFRVRPFFLFVEITKSKFALEEFSNFAGAVEIEFDTEIWSVGVAKGCCGWFGIFSFYGDSRSKCLISIYGLELMVVVDEDCGSGPSGDALVHHWNCFDRAGEKER